MPAHGRISLEAGDEANHRSALGSDLPRMGRLLS